MWSKIVLAHVVLYSVGFFFFPGTFVKIFFIALISIESADEGIHYLAATDTGFIN